MACVSGFEGLRQYAYDDVRGIPTICFGETLGVHRGDHKTTEECRIMLGDRIQEFGSGVDSCVPGPLPDARKAAYTSLAYNIGVGAFCGSSVARKANLGDARGSCDAMLLWNKAAGVPLPGLTNRRQQERALCLEGL